MRDSNLGIVLHQIRTLSPDDPASDAELIDRFVRGKDPAGFEGLVKRYGRLVWGVCRRALANQHDCEDAFQAAFLILARKAPSLDGRQSLAGWLHTVSLRVARKAKSRPCPTALADAEPGTDADPITELSARELMCAVDEELQRLPMHLREPIALCCLETLSRDEAAIRLGCTLGALKSRLERGRQLLRQRLQSRGVELPAALLVLTLRSCSAPAGALERAAALARGPATPAIAALADTATRAGWAWPAALAAVLIVAAIGLAAAGLGPPRPPAAGATPKQITTGDAPEPAPIPRVDLAGDPLPEHALARYGTVRMRQASVYYLAFAPDGKSVAIVDTDRRRPPSLWDVATGKKLYQLGGRTNDSFSAVAFSPDGNFVTAADEVVHFWNARTGERVAELRGHTNSVRSAAFSPDGKALATAGHDGTIRIWEVGTWHELAKLECPQEVLVALTWSADGKWLAAGGSSHVIRLWDTSVWRLTQKLHGHASGVDSLSFSRHGDTLASSSSYEGVIRLWDPRQGELRKLLGDGAKKQYVSATVFAPDGKTLVAATSDGTIRIWDPAAGKVVRSWRPYQMGPIILAFSADGTMLATTAPNEDSTVRFWDPATGREKCTTPFGHRGMVGRLWLSPDGRVLTTFASDGRKVRWDVSSQRGMDVPTKLPAEHRGYKSDARSSNVIMETEETWPADYWGRLVPFGDGKRVAVSVRQDKSVLLWDTEAGRELDRLRTSEETMPISKAFAPDGQTLAVGCRGGKILLWRPGTKQAPIELIGHQNDVYAVTFTPDGRRLISAAGSRLAECEVRVWDLTSRRSICTFGPTRTQRVYTLLVSPDGAWMAFDGFGGSEVHDVATGQFRWDGGGAPLGFSADSRYLLCGGDDTLSIWDVETHQLVRRFHGHRGRILTYVFSPDGRTLFTGSTDSTVLRWDLTGRNGTGPKPLCAREAAARWELLTGEAAAAEQAMWDLADSPAVTLPLIRDRLPSARRLETETLSELVKRLDADSFREREQAQAALRALGPGAEPLLHQLLATSPSPEAARRLRAVMDHFTTGPEWTRAARAIAVLERMQSEDGWRALQELAEGVPEAKLTREAKAAFRRVSGR